MMKDRKIGVSWIIDNNETLPTKEELKAFKDYHVDYVETGVLWGWQEPHYPAYTERLKEIIGNFQDGGVGVWSVHVPGGMTIDISSPQYAPSGVELTSKYMDVCAQMGVDKVVLHPSFEPINAQDRQAHIECCGKFVKELIRKDVKVALENIPRLCLANTAEEFRRVLDAAGDDIYACVDVNHIFHDSVSDMLKTVQDKLITVHLSDFDMVKERHWYPTEGVIPWKEVMQTFETINYRGCMMYELADPHKNPKKIRENYDLLCSL